MSNYKTNWTIQNKSNIDRQIYEILIKTGEKTLNYKNKQLFFQYVLMLYLTGKRRIEPFLTPITIIKMNVKGINFYKVTSSVAKHYESNIKRCKICGEVLKSNKSVKEHRNLTKHNDYIHIGKRRIVSHMWQAENKEESALWEYVCEQKSRITINFNSLLPPRYAKLQEKEKLVEYNRNNGNLLNGITLKFKQFKTLVTDGRTTVNTNIVPHMLRHLRAYDLIVNHHYKDILVQRLLDWDTHDMVYYYLDIKNMLQMEDEILQYVNQEKNKGE